MRAKTWWTKQFQRRNLNISFTSALSAWSVSIASTYLSYVKKSKIIECWWNSLLFHLFPVTVADNSWKTQLSGNFAFSELKKGGSKAGVSIETRRVEMGYTPAWDPPFFNEKRKILAKLGFITVFRNVTVKQVNIELFLTFSTFFDPLTLVESIIFNLHI